MSLGSFSRARAIIYSVMFKNSCRVLLIALMMLGGSGSVYAQIKTGDTITIRYNDSNNYLAVNSSNTLTNVNGNPTIECLWIVTISDGKYSFESVSLKNKNVTNRNLQGQNGTSLQLGGTGSTFGLGTDGDVTNVPNQLAGRFYYNYQTNRYRYIQYNNGWSMTDYRFRSGGSDRYPQYTNYDADSNPANTLLLLEKWTRKEDKGGLRVTADPKAYQFTSFISDETVETKEIKFSIYRAPQKVFYRNENNISQTIEISTKEDDTPITNISNISAAWEYSKNTISSAHCQIYGADAVTNRQLMEIKSCTSNPSNTECTVNISTIGASPMEMKTNDGKWTDHSDMLVVTFRDGATEAAYRANISVSRYSFHAEKLPEFEVKADQGSITFNKGGGDATVKITCTHQHGISIWHKTYDHGDEEVSTKIKDIYSVAPTTITDLSGIATFAPKSISEETNVNWITLSPSSTPGEAVAGPTDGRLMLTANPNDKIIARSARLVGTFTYTCPVNNKVTHTAFLQIPISQNAKDATTKFHHQKGHYNTKFGQNPFTHEDEQLVHTVERTIYYVANQNITLNLQEKRFQGYKRWYDYETQDDPRYNADAADRTTWANNGAPSGKLIGVQNDYGNTYGVYDIDQSDANTPVIKGWANGAAHIIACDVSNYKDYTFIPNTTSPEEITEPTLSYRQLFHLRPAAEIAQKFADLETGEYLEEYTYMAPIGTDIYLSTEFRYNSATESDNCYFYYADPNNKTGLTRVTSASWENGSTTSGAFRIVSSDQVTPEGSAGTVYTLTANDGNVRIAKFTVKYVDKNTYGPTTTEIISRAEILSRYVLLEEVNFNFEPLPETTSANKQLYHPLPWIESTYGYYYPNGVLGGDDKYHIHSNRSGNNIPYTGEYFLVNSLNLEWADQDNRGGAANGYVLYVDGSQEPGLVASISTSATICSGQTLYCSMWLCNPSRVRTNGTYADPIFRCNIQGRNAGDADWTDIGVYFVGDLPWGPDSNTGGSWHQVNFPVLSEVNYDEARVQIYNFGTGESGNDFMVDDIRLYASPLPLAAYHATTGCKSYTEEETTNTVVVLRIDYDYLNEDLKGENKHVYYEVFNETDNRTVQLQEKVGDVYQPIYYQDDKSNVSPNFGSILIPPTREGSGVPEKSDITSYINELTPQKGEKSKSGKCFVKDSGGKWFLYLIHVIPTGNSISGTDANVYLDRNKSYILRIAHQHQDLHKAACVFTTQLHATQDTYVQLHNDEVDSLRITSCLNNLCANNHHFLTVKVQNTIMPIVGGEMKTIEAQVHADWLTGFEFDDIYCSESAITSATQTEADNAFIAKYGYARNTIEDAIAAMRNTSPDNPNYEVDNAKNLQVLNGHLTEEQRSLIVDLCNRGLLLLYQKTKMFYLGSAATARFWVYPVAEDATVTYEGVDYTLHDCNEPKWVKLTSVESEYGVNLSPILGADQTPQQRLDVPSIRIIESTQRVAIPVKELLGSTMLSSQLTANKDTVSFLFNNPTEGVIEYVDLSRNKVEIIDAPAKLEPGKDYLMRMAFYDKDGNVYINGNPENCRVGYIYFYLSIVPNVVQWTGEASAIWGDDANWKARKTDGTLMDVGFAPLPETNVIIPTLPADKPYPIVTTDDHYPMDVNHLPNACNDIYFAPGAMIHNQHLLQYNRAFVDMTITPATWNSMAPPLKGMYTGDMYVPHSGNYSSGTNLEFKNTTDNSQYPFVVNSFKGARTSSTAYAFWQSIYNKRVPTYHENGNQSYPAITESVKFVETNSLGHPLPPGTGYQVLGYGPDNISGEIIVRLPKPDTYYSYYYSNGTPSDQGVSVTHSPKLAFEPDANGDMYITLTNALASNQFMFGNPAMANIDMTKFLEANPQLAKKYYTMSNSSWTANTWVTIEHSGTGKLAPMRSVLLELASGTATSITVKLSKSHFDGYTEPTPAGLPTRRNSATEEYDESMLMTIYATNDGGQARCIVAAKGSANDTYESQEDALFISSGVETSGDGVTATSPINMYTVSKQVPMMVDVRVNIDTVPVSMLVHDSYRTEKVKFAFYLSLNWNKECYFWDSKTDEKFRILDGLWLEMDMPENHEPRYFIIGPDMRSDNDDNVTTSIDQVRPTQVQVWAYGRGHGELVVATNDIIKEVTVYDITGRIIARQALDLYYNTTSLTVPAGVCVVEATMRDNTKQYTQAIVK